MREVEQGVAYEINTFLIALSDSTVKTMSLCILDGSALGRDTTRLASFKLRANFRKQPVRPVKRLMTEHSLEQELIDEYGPYVSITKVWKRMSFSSADAARKAADRGLVPIACFPLPYRRGRFVRTTELARWLYDALHARNDQAPH